MSDVEWEVPDAPAPVRKVARPIYGFVYELVLAGQGEHEHPYVGKCEGPTEAAATRRVHGPGESAHTSPKSIARDPWKANILPGRRGYRIVERVRSCGDPAEDDRALRRAEAYWIHRFETTHNDVRPVRPLSARPVKPKPAPRPAPVYRAPTRAEIAARRQARRRNLRLLAIALNVAVATFLAARVIVAMHLPWPAAPWVGAPMVGLIFGWSSFWWVSTKLRKLSR